MADARMNRWDYVGVALVLVMLPLLMLAALLWLIFGLTIVPVLDRGKLVGDG